MPDFPFEPEVRVHIQPPTADERLVNQLKVNDEGFNYPTYPVEILEMRCRRWARVNGLTGGAGNIATSFCKRARKKVLQHTHQGGEAAEGLPENVTPKERRLFDIRPGFHEELCQIVLNHVQLSQEIEDLNKEFILGDAPLNETVRT